MPVTLRDPISGEIQLLDSIVNADPTLVTIADPLSGIPIERQAFNGTAWVETWRPGGAGLVLPSGLHGLCPLESGSQFDLAVNAGARSTIAQAANRLDLMLFVPAQDVTVNGFALEVSTLIAASNARIGVFGSLANGRPGALVDGSGLLDCATTGVKSWTPTAPIKFLKGGVYWIGVLASATQTLRGIAVASLTPLGSAASGTALPTVRRLTQTFASGLPASPGVGTLTSTIAPWVRMTVQ